MCQISVPEDSGAMIVSRDATVGYRKPKAAESTTAATINNTLKHKSDRQEDLGE